MKASQRSGWGWDIGELELSNRSSRDVGCGSWCCVRLDGLSGCAGADLGVSLSWCRCWVDELLSSVEVSSSRHFADHELRPLLEAGDSNVLALIAYDAGAALGLVTARALIVAPWLDILLFLVLIRTYRLLFRRFTDICALYSTFYTHLPFSIIASSAWELHHSFGVIEVKLSSKCKRLRCTAVRVKSELVVRAFKTAIGIDLVFVRHVRHLCGVLSKQYSLLEVLRLSLLHELAVSTAYSLRFSNLIFEFFDFLGVILMKLTQDRFDFAHLLLILVMCLSQTLIFLVLLAKETSEFLRFGIAWMRLEESSLHCLVTHVTFKNNFRTIQLQMLLGWLNRVKFSKAVWTEVLLFEAVVVNVVKELQQRILLRSLFGSKACLFATVDNPIFCKLLEHHLARKGLHSESLITFLTIQVWADHFLLVLLQPDFLFTRPAQYRQAIRALLELKWNPFATWAFQALEHDAQRLVHAFKLVGMKVLLLAPFKVLSNLPIWNMQLDPCLYGELTLGILIHFFVVKYWNIMIKIKEK